VSLRVEDDGPGFEKQGRDLLLQRFRRASADPGGAGLGLAIAQAVVRATNGEMFLNDAELGGASVAVMWPRFQGRISGGTPRLHRGAEPRVF
jgi:signal transduction histidine kinase